MKAFFLVLPIMALTAACDTPEQSAMAGAVTGAAIGATVSGDGDKAKGAVVGGVVGLTAGALIGQSSKKGECVYRDAYGRQYIAPC